MATNQAHFANTRGLRIPRTRIPLNNQISTTCNIGDLVPIESWEVLPGDEFTISTSSIARLDTLLAPIFDDIHADYYVFYVPNRLVWEHWREFLGENRKSKYYNQTEYFEPQVGVTGTPKAKSVADYLGVPINGHSVKCSALPFRMYVNIWNEWFRDEQLQDPLLVDISDNDHAWDDHDPLYGGKLLKTCKYHDYFTSCLPQPQAGPPVQIPMMNSGDFPVYATGKNHDHTNFGLHFQHSKPMTGEYHAALFDKNSTDDKHSALVFNAAPFTPGTGVEFGTSPSNLWATIDGLPVTDINTLRLAFCTQQFLERNNIGGLRYNEIIRNHFAVVTSDATIQRPELIGYFHDTLNVSQVVNQAESAENPIGEVGGLSATYMSGGVCRKAFEEHGRIMLLASFRYKHSYQQGIDRSLTRRNKFDYYWPIFANLGEQPVLNKEIYVDGTDADNEVFGYQERWAEYRYKPNRVSGEMRSSFAQTRDYWTLCDNYSSRPKLDGTWIQEDKAPVNRAIAISDSVADQLSLNFYFETSVVRSMPIYSIPGLTRM